MHGALFASFDSASQSLFFSTARPTVDVTAGRIQPIDCPKAIAKYGNNLIRGRLIITGWSMMRRAHLDQAAAAAATVALVAIADAESTTKIAEARNELRERLGNVACGRAGGRSAVRGERHDEAKH